MSKKVREVFSGEKYQKTQGSNVELHDAGDFFSEKNVEYAINQMGNDLELLKEGGIGGGSGGPSLDMDITYYVSTTGDDTHDGLSLETALLTIQAAINKIPKVLNANASVIVAQGAYDEERIDIAEFSGMGQIYLKAEVDAIVEARLLFITDNDCLCINIENLKTVGVSANFNRGELYFYGCSAIYDEVLSITSNGFSIDQCADVFVDGCFSSGYEYAMKVFSSKVDSSEWLDGSSATTVGMLTFGGSIVMCFGNQPTGASAMVQTSGGVVMTSGQFSQATVGNRINHEEITLLANAWTGTEAPYEYEYALNRDPNDAIEGAFMIAVPNATMDLAHFTNYKASDVVAGGVFENLIYFTAYGATKPTENFTMDITFWDATPSSGT